MKHVVKIVVRSLLARDHVIEPRIRQRHNRRDQFLVNAARLGQRLPPCRLARVRDRRKILRVGELHRDPTQPPQHRPIPCRNVQHQFPDRMSILNRTRRRLRRRNPLQNFEEGIAMPSIAIKRAPQLVANASRFRLIFHLEWPPFRNTQKDTRKRPGSSGAKGFSPPQSDL